MLAAHSHESGPMTSERNVGPSGCARRAWRVSDPQSADPGYDRLQGGDEREDDPAAGDDLELAGPSFGAAA